MAGPVWVDQALFGYKDGHRLIASSRSLSPESVRLLRTATDVSFRDGDVSYLTALPLASDGVYAISRTWLASEWTRPGSVWAHVILIDFATLGSLRNFEAVLNLFSRPPIVNFSIASASAAYSIPLQIGPGAQDGVPLDTSVRNDEALLAALYSTNLPVVWGAMKFADYDRTLAAAYEQQWARLRRSFAFRSRERSEESVITFDLELVEGESGVDIAPSEPWTRFLAEDLRRPDPRFRDYLARVGAESTRGREDMKFLTNVHLDLRDLGSTGREMAELIQSTYPTPSAMRSLKRMVYGHDERVHVDQGGTWSETRRLSLALAFPESLDYLDLEIASRLAAVLTDHAGPRGVIENANVDAMTDDQIHLIVDGLVSGLDSDDAARAAGAHEELGVLILSRRPALLENPSVWQHLDSELLVTLLAGQPEVEQDRVLLALAEDSAIEALTSVVAADTSRWWRLLRLLSRADASSRGSDAGSVLRSTLERVGVAALSGRPRQPNSHEEIELLLRSGDLAWGLWRRIDASQWTKALRNRLKRDQPSGADLDRLAAVTLVTSSQSQDPAVRMSGWQTAFPYLHEALKSENFETQAWALVSTALPSGPAWDRCQRLRTGAISEIRRDSWAPDAAAHLIRTAGSFGSEMRSRLEEANRKKKRRSWLEEFLDRFS